MNLRLRVVHGLTNDHAALHQAVIDFYAQPQGIDEQDEEGGSLAAAAFVEMQRRRDATSAAFEGVATYLHGLPGRKKLVWLSASMPLFYAEKRNNMIDRSLDSSPELFAAARKLNEANTALYPVDPVGAFRNHADEAVNTMLKLSDMTGGKAYYGFNDIDHGIEEAVNDTEVTYTLGFYPTPDKAGAKPRDTHSLDVKVTRGSGSLRYRRNYASTVSTKPVSEATAVRRLDDWVQAPLDATEIPIAAMARRVANKPGTYAVEVAIDLAAARLENKNGKWRGVLDLAIAPDKKGKVKGLHQVVRLNLTDEEYSIAMTRGLALSNAFDATGKDGKLLSPRLHVAVIDRATGRAGSVRLTLDLPPAVE